MTSKEEILTFLESSKKLIASGNYDFVPRRKNLLSLAMHGISLNEAKAVITNLTSSDYYKGPKQDFSRPGEIWEFKKEIGSVDFYIKLKIDLEGNHKVLKCLGFHEDEFAANGNDKGE